MIDLSTPNNVLISEIRDEYKRATYWFYKKHGGEAGKERLMTKQELECFRKKTDIVSDVVEYKSPHGNRWRIFMHTRYYADVKAPHTSMQAFIYYETYASCGAFIPTFNPMLNEISGCIIYTPHFFQRFCERLKIPYRSSSMIARFLEMVPGSVAEVKDEKMGRFHKCDIALPGSIGRGILRQEEPNPIIEVKTFLTNPELTRHQKKDTARLHKAQREYEYEPVEIAIERTKDMTLKEVVERSIDRQVAMGLPREIVEAKMNLDFIVAKTFEALEYKLNEDAGVWMNKVVRSTMESAWRCLHHEEYKDISPFYEALMMADDTAKAARISNADLNEVAKYMAKEIWKEDVSDFDEYDWAKETAKYRKIIDRFNEKYEKEHGKQRTA